MIPDAFHDHLDVCEQCRDHPFDLCALGDCLIREAVGSGSLLGLAKFMEGMGE